MPQQRHKDETVEAFSAPRALLEAARERAIELRMTKSGFYRYCLAKELGHSEHEARAFAEHGSVRNALAALERSAVHRYPAHRSTVESEAALNEAEDKLVALAKKRVKKK